MEQKQNTPIWLVSTVKCWRAVFLCMVAMLLLACTDNISLSGNKVSISKKLDHFHAISLNDGIELVFQQDTVRTLKFEVDESLQPFVRYMIQQGVLSLYCMQQHFFPSDSKITIHVNADSVDVFNVSSGSMARLMGKIEMDTISLQLAGGSSLTADTIHCHRLNSIVGSRSTVSLEGLVKVMRLQVSDESLVKAFAMEADTAIVYAASGSTLNLFVNKDLIIDAAGASVVNYIGGDVVSSALLTGGSKINRKQ